ncbi:unnamed protein product [Pleuronectes platessa]|uniref:Uncharacterized protein n=1 Tax=Pleuronectes platessa TaxID=8262 RepID=A0A9N7URE6_PLEPL|nr:unnamed protein product [Pleuronectes platessa]
MDDKANARLTARKCEGCRGSRHVRHVDTSVVVQRVRSRGAVIYVGTRHREKTFWLARRLSGRDRPVPAACTWLLRRRAETRVRESQEASLVRSSVLRRNRRRAPGRSIIPHQASPQVTQASEGRRAEGAWSEGGGGGCRECDTLRDALCLRVEETRTRLLLGPVSALKPISCYDTVPVP